MSKIAKIELEDIRIYKGKEEFDFLYHETEVANLITIYGPNGFGKSSFFDACEWAMSGKIQRFEHDKESQELLDEQDLSLPDKVFLNNRDSYREKNDFTGNVNFYISGQQEPCGRFIKERTKRGQRYKQDYKLGEFFGSNEGKFIKTSENKLLSQTMIDAFLRSDTPEKRFEIVSVMIPRLNQTVTLYNSLKKYYQEIGSEKGKIEKRINELETNQKLLLSELPSIDKINALILQYNELNLFNEKLNFTSNKITTNEYDKLSTTIYKNKLQIENLLEKKEKVLIELNRLIKDYTDYEDWRRKHDKVISDINEINKLIKLHIDLREKEKAINVLINQEKKQKSILNDYIELQNLQSSYIEFQEKINKNIELEKNERIQVYKYDRNISEISKQLIELTERKNNLVLEKEYLEEQVSEHKFKIQRKKEINQEQFKIINEIKPLKDNVEDLRRNIEEFQSIKNHFERIIKDFTVPENFQPAIEIQNLINQRTQVLIVIDETKKEIENKELDLEKAGNLNENLNRIIAWGHDIIKETKSSNCPLCNHHYQSHEDLLSHVNSEKEDILDLINKENIIKKLKQKVEEQDEKRKSIEKNIKEIVHNEIKALSNRITELKENKDKIENIVHEKTISTERGRNELDEIENFLEKYFSDLPLVEDENGNKLGRLPDLVKELGDLEKEIKENEKRKIDLETSVKKSKLGLNDLKNQNKRIEEDEKFIKAKALLNKYEHEDIFEYLIKINELISKQTNKIEHIQTEIKTHNENFENIRAEIERKKHFGQENELKGNIQEKDADKNILKSKILAFENSYQKVVKKQEITYSNLEAEIENQKITKIKIENSLKIAEDLKTEVKVLDVTVKFNEINSNIENETLKLKKTDIAYLKFEKSVKDCQKVIEDVVANKLNKKTINNIYRRIEPHPELNEIDFKVEFSESEKPLLKIITKSEKEILDPILYLSSGQINVLSLSIFLAKALQDTEGLDTIFMDDPIQNLSDINILSFIDLIRTLISKGDKQIIISTHYENFFNLLKNKLPENHYKSKYLELESYGKLKKSYK